MDQTEGRQTTSELSSRPEGTIHHPPLPPEPAPDPRRLVCALQILQRAGRRGVRASEHQLPARPGGAVHPPCRAQSSVSGSAGARWLSSV